jgi:hypothetical protein
VLRSTGDFVPARGIGHFGEQGYADLSLPSGAVWLGTMSHLGHPDVPPRLHVEPGRYRLTSPRFEEPVERLDLEHASQLPVGGPPDWEFEMVRLPDTPG